MYAVEMTSDGITNTYTKFMTTGSGIKLTLMVIKR
jgi:hypothetical protein